MSTVRIKLSLSQSTPVSVPRFSKQRRRWPAGHLPPAHEKHRSWITWIMPSTLDLDLCGGQSGYRQVMIIIIKYGMVLSEHPASARGNEQIFQSHNE